MTQRIHVRGHVLAPNASVRRRHDGASKPELPSGIRTIWSPRDGPVRRCRGRRSAATLTRLRGEVQRADHALLPSRDWSTVGGTRSARLDLGIDPGSFVAARAWLGDTLCTYSAARA